MENTNENSKEELSVYELLKQIKEGAFNPRMLTPEQRQECVEVLRMEGQTHATIAELLKWNIKTIKRDWDDIRSKNATKPSPELALRMIAELIEKAGAKHDHLTRLARSKEGSVQEKSQAEFYSWKVVQEAAQLLQSLGYLPNQAAKFTGDVYHHHDNEAQTDPKEMKKEIERIERIIAEEGKDDPAIKVQLEDIKKKVELIELGQQIKDLSSQVSGESTKGKENETNG